MSFTKTLAILLFTVAANNCLADTKRFEICKSKLIQAQKLGVLYDLDWKPPTEPKVIAGKTFFSISIDAKEGFAETVNCFLVAGDQKFVNFDILSWKTGTSVGRFSYGKFKIN